MGASCPRESSGTNQDYPPFTKTTLWKGGASVCRRAADPVLGYGTGKERADRPFQDAHRHQALFHHRTLFEDYGLFDEQYPLVADYEFQLRIWSRQYEPCRFLPLIIAGHRHGGLTTRRKRRLSLLKEAEGLRRRYGIQMPIHRKMARYGGALVWTFLGHGIGERGATRVEEALLRLRSHRPRKGG